MEIQGKIIVDLPLMEGTSKMGKPWKKKEYVLETINTPYPRKVKFDFFGDRADTYPLEIGKVYSVTFDLESREFNGRWYTDVRGISAVEVGGQMGPAPQNFGQPAGFNQQPADFGGGFNQPGGFQTPQQTAQPDFGSNSDEELPF